MGKSPLFDTNKTIQNTSSHASVNSSAENPFDKSADKQLDNAFDLISLWGRLYDRADYWPEVCRQWAEKTRENRTIERAFPFLNKLFRYSNEKEESAYLDLRNKRRAAGDISSRSFYIDKNGIVETLGSDAALELDLTIGKSIEQSLREPLNKVLHEAQFLSRTGALAEFIGPDATRHLINIHPVDPFATTLDRFKISLYSFALPLNVEKYTKQKLGLTETEIDILERSMQRHSIEAIAKIRRNSVSTIRTHHKNIIKKFGCRSFTDVVIRTQEIIAFQTQEHQPGLIPVSPKSSTHRTTNILKLISGHGQIEYSRYGDAGGKPLLVLHSLEYGYVPSRAFLEEAKKNGYSVYAPLRPGFGRTSPAQSVALASEMIEEFLSLLNLRDITLVAQSMAVPTALNLAAENPRIKKTIAVNYAFNASNKIENIEPKWLKGLLDLGLKSTESFKFAIRMTSKMFRMVGYNKFYAMIYRDCLEDMEYLSENPEDLEMAANTLFSAHEESVRLDLTSSLQENKTLPSLINKCAQIISIRGRNTHRVPVEQAQTQAAQYNIPFMVIEDGGRNCTFHSAGKFFELITDDVIDPAPAKIAHSV